MTITLKTRALIRTLWLLLAATLILYALTFYLPSVLNVHPPLGESLTRSFNILEEGNLPTLFSTVLFFLAAAAAALIAKSLKDAYTSHWACLAALFIFCAIDETVCFHEQASFALQQSLGLQGALYYSWFLPAALLVAALTFLYLPVIIKLPASARLKIIAGGVLFVGGAVGFEPIQGWIVSNQLYFQMERLAISLASIEETVELAGLILFIDGALSYLSAESPDLQISISS